jgi:hypothetical protein
MINLRYHIVSITAVFLALGIGVALGSTLIQRGLVDNLNDRLDEQVERLDRTDGENAELREELDQIAELESQLTTQGTSLSADHLTDVPVVVVTVQGVGDELIDLTRRSLRAADATPQGVLRFTMRWEELDELEIAELGELTDRPLADPDGARTRVLRDLAQEMLVASEDPVEEDPALDLPIDPEAGTGAEAVDDHGGVVPAQEEPTTTTTAPEEEPNGLLLTALIERGYIEFLPDAASTPLPEAGARYVVVSSDAADLEPALALLPLLEELAAADPAPVVVAEPLPLPEDDQQDEGEDAGDEDGRPAAGEIVTAVRADPQMQLSITTTDVAGRFVGQAAIVLGLADLASTAPSVGHYGVAVGATSLLPVTEG